MNDLNYEQIANDIAKRLYGVKGVSKVEIMTTPECTWLKIDIYVRLDKDVVVKLTLEYPVEQFQKASQIAKVQGTHVAEYEVLLRSVAKSLRELIIYAKKEHKEQQS